VPQLGRILIVDDEPKIRSFIGRALDAAGYATESADGADEGLRRALNSHYDLVILDLLMPDLDGRQMLRKLVAARPDQPVIVLSCVADVAAKVDCLERGAQDYLTKPFSLAELLARVRVRLRGEAHGHAEAYGHAEAHGHGEADEPAAPLPRPHAQAPGGTHPHTEVIRAGDVTLDVARLVADAGHGPVPLTRLEFLLLRELAEHVGQSVPKGKLLASVWGYDFDPGSNVVDVCVRRLRSKLGFDLIKTVRGEGYQLVAR
jgi:DNA-binding response OmpR family regulator